VREWSFDWNEEGKFCKMVIEADSEVLNGKLNIEILSTSN
jgi:hypothetical protein